MPVRALFVGINEYADPKIKNLRAARPDAVALHALFVDTLPDLRATCLLDGEASHDRVLAELKSLLRETGSDDVVIVTFSGHGTPDNRLVLADTKRCELDATAISMGWIADEFRASRARAVILVLDCCFSGAAPARVLDDAPIPRDMDDAAPQIAGRGRVLITASKHDEPAWESRGHGLLTAALIAVLGREGGPHDLTAVSADVLDFVRGEAMRMGKDQTPVFLGHIEGGLRLPALRPGPLFAAAFPDRVGVRVTAAIDDLAAFGIPDEVLAVWRAECPHGLNPMQLAAVNEHRVLDGASLVVVAPTGAGKTFVGELAALRAVAERRRAVFLMPYRALVSEKYEEFLRRYSNTLGLRVMRCQGDYTDDAGAIANGKYDIALLTYEMFLNLAVAVPSMVSNIGIAIVDEAQFLADPQRGIAVELLLTLLVAGRSHGSDVQVLALSAVIGDVNHFPEWLNAKLLRAEERPVALIEGVLDRDGTFQYRDVDGTTKTQQLLSRTSIVQRGKEPSARDVIVPLTAQLVRQGETVLVFRNQRGPTEGCAEYLSRELSLPAAKVAMAALPTVDRSATSRRLADCLRGGTAFHNANLSRDERRIVEHAFRTTGEVRALAATTTLAAGLNTPASTVIIAETKFVGDEERPFTVAEYKNMAGRAGRPGLSSIGRAVLLADHAVERASLYRRYVLGSPEDLRSTFVPTELATWILRLFSQVRRVPAAGVVHLLASTYGGYLAALTDPEWGQRMRQQLERVVDRLLALELVDKDGDHLRLTLLGSACGRSPLVFDSCLRLVDVLRRLGRGPAAEQLMTVLQVLPESDEIYTPFMSRAGVEKERPRELAAVVGNDVVRTLQRFADDEAHYAKRCKRVLILREWIAGTPIETIEERYSPTPFAGRISYGDIRRFADTTRFHLRAAAQIARVMFPDIVEHAEEDLARRLELGIPADCLRLLDVRCEWTRGELLALRRAGARDAKGLVALGAARLESMLGKARAEAALRNAYEVAREAQATAPTAAAPAP